MCEVSQAYSFAGVYELANFKTRHDRIAKPWPMHRTRGLKQALVEQLQGLNRRLELLSNHRRDAREIRHTLQAHLATGRVKEVWTDEPGNHPMRLVHGLFPKATHVKFPHAFCLEDPSSFLFREQVLEEWREEATWRRNAFWHLARMYSSVRFNLQLGSCFDRAYTFDVESPWSDKSVDVSRLVTSSEMVRAYGALPAALRREIESQVNAASGGNHLQWALLLLFELDERARAKYVQAMVRIVQQHPDAFGNLQFVVKPHPLNRDGQPELLAQELSQALNKPVTIFNCALSLDILWSVVPARLVFAGPCGALPVARRLGAATTIVLREILDEWKHRHPGYAHYYDLIVDGIDVW